MLIDWNNFTPWSALAGGTLIGVAASLFVLLNGRITRIIGGLFTSRIHEAGWSVTFIVGLIIAPLV